MTADFLCQVSLWRADADKPAWTVRVTEEKKARRADQPCEPLGLALAADGKRAFVAWELGVAEIDRDSGKVLRTIKLPGRVNTTGQI
ncbi:MAG: hypothetical protein K2V38_10485, partial [Gemmataceae bacterium]|nr:hypothetical protein [Gemmataceae bacterium]